MNISSKYMGSSIGSEQTLSQNFLYRIGLSESINQSFTNVSKNLNENYFVNGLGVYIYLHIFKRHMHLINSILYTTLFYSFYTGK